MNRTLGGVLVAAAGVIALVGILLLVVNMSSSGLSAGGAILGALLLLAVVVLPLGGLGIFLVVRGRGEEKSAAKSEDMRKILDMVDTRGKVSLSDVIIETQSDRPYVQDMVYRIVGMGLFSGYINWDEGMLYSQEAASLTELKECKHCGGQIELAGKGVMKCPFCGTEYFLS